ncbi:MAG TPA: hypothetical protein GX498_04295 [Clostridiales bacterium]|nr:hypothetical protein [Clostridiales bacterium]
MKYKTHRAGALSILALFILVPYILGFFSFNINNLSIIGLCPFLVYFFSTLPDKIESAHRTWAHSIISLTLILFTLYSAKPIIEVLLLKTLQNISSNHIKLIQSTFSMSILIGWGSHLLFDSLTDSGIPVFYPINKKRYNLYKIGTYNNDRNEQILFWIFTYFLVITVIFVTLKIAKISINFLLIKLLYISFYI